MTYTVIITVLTFIITALVFLKNYLYGAMYKGKYRLDGKTAIITGANTGIGKEVAKDLIKRGARVILACRNLESANKTATEIRKITNIRDSNKVVVKYLDLASLTTVRNFVKDIYSKEDRLDILINNAGVLHCPYWKTVDGFEMQFCVNYLGHFLLSYLLLDLLKKSAPCRVVTLSSWLYEKGRINFEDIHSEKSYDPMKSYIQSKLATVLFTRELAKRLHGTGVTTYCLHPGVARTNISRHMRQQQPFLRPIYFLYQNLPLFKDPVHGAQTVIYCAVDKALENKTGRYYTERTETALRGQALDDDVAKKLWQFSEKMVDVNMNDK